MAVPKLDFALFSHGDDLQRLSFARALVDAFKDHGFVKLINHGMPDATVVDYLSASKQLFALSAKEKLAIANEAGPRPQRGWSRKGVELTSKTRDQLQSDSVDKNNLRDEREFFDAGPADDQQFPNKWPSKAIPTLQPLLGNCYELLQQVSIKIIAAVEIGLDLDPGTLTDQCFPSASEIRLNYYPPVDVRLLRGSSIRRTWPHTDLGIISLLFQDQVGGLEIEDRKMPGNFIPVSPSPPGQQTELVVNVSDTLERWTNGYIAAGVHRVDVPSCMKEQNEGVCESRYSSVYFMKAARETSVGPVPALITAACPAKYDNITALEFQSQRTALLY